MKKTSEANFSLNKLEATQKKFGLQSNSIETVESIDDLRSSIPNIVIAECKHSFKFQINKGIIQELRKKEKYVMSLSIYAQLEYDDFIRKNGSPRLNLKPAKVQFKKIYRPYMGQNLSNKTLLVTRTGGIGDLLFIQPNLIYLKEKYPTCKIIFATSIQYHSMIKNWDCVDKVVTLPFSDKLLYQSNYHLIFEGVIERTKQAHYTNAYELFSKWMGLDLPKSVLRPQQNASSEIVNKISKLLTNEFNIDIKKNKLCVVQLKASSPIRTPHPKQLWHNILKFIKSRDYKIIIVDNPLLHDQIDNVIDTYFSDIKDDIINFVKYSEDISHAIALAKIADMVIGPDSSMVHIAESVGTKNFGIYGPFPGEIRLSTYLYNDWVDCKSDCAPCFTHGHKPCIYGGMNGGCSPCYNNLNMSEFIDKFKKLEIRNV